MMQNVRQKRNEKRGVVKQLARNANGDGWKAQPGEIAGSRLCHVDADGGNNAATTELEGGCTT